MWLFGGLFTLLWQKLLFKLLILVPVVHTPHPENWNQKWQRISHLTAPQRSDQSSSNKNNIFSLLFHVIKTIKPLFLLLCWISHRIIHAHTVPKAFIRHLSPSDWWTSECNVTVHININTAHVNLVLVRWGMRFRQVLNSVMFLSHASQGLLTDPFHLMFLHQLCCNLLLCQWFLIGYLLSAWVLF